MGHYASEMSCDRCGKLRCSCPSALDESLEKWAITGNFKIVPAKELGISRFFMKLFSTAEEARRALPATIEVAIKVQEDRLTQLKQILVHAQADLKALHADSETQCQPENGNN